MVVNFFTKDTIKKETIVGVSPVVSTKSIRIYQEPLKVILESEKTKEEKKVILPIIEEVIEEQKQEGNKESVTIDTNFILEKQEDSNQKDDVVELEKKGEETVEEIQSPILTEYKGFKTVGKIEIPQTGVDIPILNQVTVEGMKNAPCLLYATGELNQNGNNLIVGHNFRNGTIFSNNKNLKIGDKIYVTTLDGIRIEYTIYDKFITTAEDVSYIKRDTKNKPEITLSCCTDDDEYRIIILAK